MSLLESRAHYDHITVYLEEVVTDSDGNIRTRPSTTGTPTVARFQVESQSGTSQRDLEAQKEGFETEQFYLMRLPRDFPYVLGAQAELDWQGKRWCVFGDVIRYSGSPKTSHLVYTVRRR